MGESLFQFRVLGLRPRDARYGRHRNSARGQMQKLSAGEFHLELPFTVPQRSGSGINFAVCTVTATSLALGNIDIDQAVISAIAAIIGAAKVTTGRMTPTSEGRPAPAGFI